MSATHLFLFLAVPLPSWGLDVLRVWPTGGALLEGWGAWARRSLARVGPCSLCSTSSPGTLRGSDDGSVLPKRRLVFSGGGYFAVCCFVLENRHPKVCLRMCPGLPGLCHVMIFEVTGSCHNRPAKCSFLQKENALLWQHERTHDVIF